MLPDVDLKMVATKTGQASVYVVKTEKAARSAALDDLHVVIQDAALTTKKNGSVEAEAADGSQIVAGQPPLVGFLLGRRLPRARSDRAGAAGHARRR
ncbi:hypothetical protein JM654_19825 [Microbacterium oxydans]|nr:hypothetical protein [Microbacterium oxydans]